MKTKTLLPVLLLLLPALALTSCSKDSTSSGAPGLGTMRVQMTDAPADIDALHLVILEVTAHRTGGGSDPVDGWEVLNDVSATYDLLTLRNGVFTTIGMASMPSGRYTQLRLKLGPGSTIVVDGVTYPLTVPSGLQSGLKLVGEFDVPAGGLVDVALDFDASRSVVQTGAGAYLLKPVIKVMPFSTAGAISGTVLPAGTPTTVYAIQSADTLGSAQTGIDGTFKVSVLPAGVYALAFRSMPAYRDTTLSGVVVIAGGTTSVGDVQLTLE